MWRRERDTFTGLSFFFPLNLGSEVTTVEKVEKEAVCHRKPCLQKSRILSQGDKQGKQLSVRSSVMFFCSEIFTGWLPALCAAIAVVKMRCVFCFPTTVTDAVEGFTICSIYELCLHTFNTFFPSISLSSTALLGHVLHLAAYKSAHSVLFYISLLKRYIYEDDL